MRLLFGVLAMVNRKASKAAIERVAERWNALIGTCAYNVEDYGDVDSATFTDACDREQSMFDAFAAFEAAAEVADRCAVHNGEAARSHEFSSVNAQKYRARANEAAIIADAIRRLTLPITERFALNKKEKDNG